MNKKIKVKTLLYTKDGRKIGNAIVLKAENDLFYIKTDYGNTATLNEKEIEEYFYIGPQANKDHKYLQINKDVSLLDYQGNGIWKKIILKKD